MLSLSQRHAASHRLDRQSHRLDGLFKRFSPEAHQLCESQPFRLWCAGKLPGKFTPPRSRESDAICTACDNPLPQNSIPSAGENFRESPSHHQQRPCPSCGHPSQHHELLHQHEQLKWTTEPEAMAERMGLNSWEAPYVWETNYF